MKAVPLSKVNVAGNAPLTSPLDTGFPASDPSAEKFRICRDAACVTNEPGLKLKSRDPGVPAIDVVFTVTLYITGDGRATSAHPKSTPLKKMH